MVSVNVELSGVSPFRVRSVVQTVPFELYSATSASAA